MQVQVSGQHISVAPKLQDYVNNRTIEVVTKYFAEAPSGHVYFSKNNHEFVCDIVVNEGSGRHIILKSHAVCNDIYSAYDQSISKLQKQLRRYKSKLNDYSHKMKLSEKMNDATSYTISSQIENQIENEVNVDNPAIIAETPSKIMTLSVGEAVMKMDLHNLPALMFKNIKNNRFNIVYYRRDGNIAWVDSKSEV